MLEKNTVFGVEPISDEEAIKEFLEAIVEVGKKICEFFTGPSREVNPVDEDTTERIEE